MAPDIIVPQSEINRQAVDSLRGYFYQIYQSLEAWIDLADDETLLLEVAEDFAVVTKSALKGVQIKDVGGSVTLKNEGVRQTLNAYWAYKQANPTRKVSAAFITTASIGKEQKVQFPENARGIEYWLQVARDESETQALRDYLITTDLSEELLEFIKNSSDEDFRTLLLRQITWCTNAPDFSVLEQNIRDKLICFGENMHLMPSDSGKALGALVNALLLVAVKPNQSGRTLTRAAFLSVFEQATTINVPIASYRASLEQNIISNSSLALYSDQVPQTENGVERKDLVSQYSEALSRDGALWLHGSSGLGKTQLALRVAGRSGRKWLVMDLRNCNSQDDLDKALFTAFRAINTCEVSGVILDDMPAQLVSKSQRRLQQLTQELARLSATLIVTAYQAPPATFIYIGGGLKIFAAEIPYLSVEEVGEFISNFGGNPDWAKFIHAFSNNGHPTLIHAKLSGLKARGWPTDELRNEYSNLGQKNPDVENERQSIRQRLITELPEPTRVLLDRLSVVIGYFDLETAKSLANIEPQVNRPGEQLTLLCGPWIEAKGNNLFTLSPLISGIGNHNLSATEMKKIGHAVVDHILKSTPIPGHMLNQLFCHALLSQHEVGLMWIAGAIVQSEYDDRDKLLEYIYLFPLLDGYDDKPIFPGSISLSFMLRVAQFRLTAVADRPERMRPIFERLLVEGKQIDQQHEEIEGYHLSLATALMETSLHMSPSEWMPYILQLKEHVSQEDKLSLQAELFKKKVNFEDVEWDAIQAAFMARASKLKNVDELEELFNELNAICPNVRDYLLCAANEQVSGTNMIVQGAWAAECSTEEFDGHKCSEQFRKLSSQAANWGQQDIAIECECARAVMLNEYVRDSESAHHSIDQAIALYGTDQRFILNKAKVYHTGSNYSDALNAFRSEVSRLNTGSNIQNAYILRQAAVSAGHCDEWEEAYKYFTKAQEFSENTSDIMAYMIKGLIADRAVAQFQQGKLTEAVTLLLEALKQAKPDEIRSEKREKNFLLLLAHTIIWIRSQINGNFPGDHEMVPGAVSNPDPHEDLQKLSDPDFLLLQYQLVEIEVEAGTNTGCLEYLREHTKNGQKSICELMLSATLIKSCYVNIDIEKFSKIILFSVKCSAFFVRDKERLRSESVFSQELEIIPELTDNDAKDDDFQYVFYSETLAFICVLVLSGNKKLVSDLYLVLSRAHPAWVKSSSVFDDLNLRLEQATKSEVAAAASIGLLMHKKVNPNDAFMLSYRLWEWLSRSDRQRDIAPHFAYRMVQLWNDIVRNQRFSILCPNVCIPAIEIAINDTTEGLQKVANIILAAENAVDHRLNEMIRKQLREYVSPN